MLAAAGRHQRREEDGGGDVLKTGRMGTADEMIINLALLTAPWITLRYAPGHSSATFVAPRVGDIVSPDELHTILKVTHVDGVIVIGRPYPNEEERVENDARIEQALADHRRGSV